MQRWYVRLGAFCSLVGLFALTLISSPASSAGAAVSASFTGAPVKFGVITPTNAAALSYPQNLSSVRAAIAGVNKAGGIAGHKVVLDYCNDNDDPNQGAACGRQMVSDGVIAVTGASIVPTSWGPILNQAHIPVIGMTPTALEGFQDPNEYLLDSGSLFGIYAASAFYGAAKPANTNVWVMRADLSITASVISTVQSYASTVGIKYVGQSAVPETATDMSPYAGAAQQAGAGCILSVLANVQSTQVIEAGNQIGNTKVKYCLTASDTTQQDLISIGSPATSQLIFGNQYPPLSAAASVPGLRKFIAQMKTEQKTGDANANLKEANPTVIENWMAVTVVAQILPKKLSAVTAATVTNALNSAKNINMGGIIPPWTPSQAGPAPYTRASDPWIYYTKGGGKNGNQILVKKTPYNVFKLLGIS